MEHLLFDCPWTKAVWFGSSLNMRADQGSITNVTKWTNDHLQGGNSKKESKRLISLVAIVARFIWKSRNDFVFNHQVVDPQATLQKITHFRKEQDDLIGQFNPFHQALAVPNHNPRLGWQPASHSTVKFNCDAAFCEHSSSAVMAVILRDSKGNLLDGCAKSIKASSAVQAEAHAVCMACLMAQALILSQVEIKVTTKCCVSEIVPPWEYNAVIMGIRGLASPTSVLFSWTRRNNNEAAHWVAKACLSKSLPVNWGCMPTCCFCFRTKF
ncbi:uncharacterized protein LOC114270535 [Camellia sinensis]|uniref:uncharacterized protein LOC114270535 n=1 Tax=Camellia sinensis TaxID=4442 RepID=UPI0010356168|nr:uncharacterized protein LOC114270535 [Camellia sinensis]